MPITPYGYAVGTGIFTPAEIHQMQTSITETINRLACGFLTPYATSCPELPLAELAADDGHAGADWTENVNWASRMA